MGKVTITRKPSGAFAMFGQLPVYFNKVKQPGLKRGETKVYEFDGTETSLKVGSGFMASKAILVQDGQEIEASTVNSSYLLWMAGLIFCLFFRGLIPAILGIGLLATAFFRPFFKAEVVEK